MCRWKCTVPFVVHLISFVIGQIKAHTMTYVPICFLANLIHCDSKRFVYSTSVFEKKNTQNLKIEFYIVLTFNAFFRSKYSHAINYGPCANLNVTYAVSVRTYERIYNIYVCMCVRYALAANAIYIFSFSIRFDEMFLKLYDSQSNGELCWKENFVSWQSNDRVIWLVTWMPYAT